MPFESFLTSKDPFNPDSLPPERTRGDTQRSHQNNAATGVSAAGARALGAQAIAFYFRAPVKAFFRTRVEYASMPLSFFLRRYSDMLG